MGAMLYRGYSSGNPVRSNGSAVSRPEVMSKNRPHAHRLTGVDEAERRAMGLEADEGTFGRDIHGGIAFLSHLALLVLDGKYDQRFGPELEAVVYEKASGKRAVIPAKGFKGHKDIV